MGSGVRPVALVLFGRKVIMFVTFTASRPAQIIFWYDENSATIQVLKVNNAIRSSQKIKKTSSSVNIDEKKSSKRVPNIFWSGT